ncbi:TetR/AcrR family transcriptional regulator [Anaerocolumna sp. AGMB13025]|uniref:TetR/AcrR family transcriptional regulator n=1 Tax=Anaerocolumna sp. AGMB13025 TaxID=3039116 RepID=UPI00241FC450|nr:TetR/AcrR family transcriptional regulator [Anaerocolumna sp. AGMB13025]WFR55815.1 TetR/AcrR family transcriptional regulator [Anaerocolumna sp. AGMB13025]
MSATAKRHSNKETNRLTREAICTALVLLMKNQVFDKISITDLVKRAGVSRTAYYSNYSSKQEILYDLVDSLILEINEKLLPYTDESNGKAKYPREFIKVMLNVFYQRKDIYKTLYEAHFNHIILDRLNQSMLSRLQDKSNENIYRIYFNAGALYNVFSKWIQSEMTETIDEMTDICLTIYHTPMSSEHTFENMV